MSNETLIAFCKRWGIKPMLEFQAWDALSDEAFKNFEQELTFQGDWPVNLGTEDVENAAGVLQPWQQLPPGSWS